MMAISVQLRAEWVERVGYRYDVLLDREVIVRGSRDPEHDAARVLHARGLRGRFRTVDFFTGRPRMEHDIEKAAGLCTIERGDTGLTVVPYRPMSEADKSRARLHRACQGGPSTTEIASHTGRPVKLVGGERAPRSSRSLQGASHDTPLVPALPEYEDA